MSVDVLNPRANDAGVAKQSGTTSTKTKTVYSEEEREEFRQIIDRKILKTEKLIAFLTGSTENFNGTNDTGPEYKGPIEEGKSTYDKEQNMRDRVRQEKFLEDLKEARARTYSPFFGRCRETGKLIPKDRLKAVPHATLCADAKEKVNGNGKLRPYHQLSSKRF